MTITKYFNADVEDAVRIAVVTSENEDDMAECPEAQTSMGAKEIEAEDLPEDFANWKRYTAHAYNHGPSSGSIVEVMSKDGD